MSVVVWDGNCLAADRSIIERGVVIPGSRMQALVDPVPTAFAWTGPVEKGFWLYNWYLRGAKEDEWPEWQMRKGFARLIVATERGAYLYENLPLRVNIGRRIGAWGSGREFALGALHAGASAVMAADIAQKLCSSCGGGVQAYDFTAGARDFFDGMVGWKWE